MKRDKNSTIKNHVNQTLKEKTETLFPAPENSITFDSMIYILAHRDKVIRNSKINRIPNNVFLIDLDEDENFTEHNTLAKLIEFVAKEVGDVKFGVLCRVAGHTTPFFIEKIIPENEKLNETIYIYNTDSVVMDIDQGEIVKELIRSLSKKNLGDVDLKIFSLGINDREGKILANYRRQTNTYSCAVFSLYDIEYMLKNNFLDYAKAHSHPISDSLYCLQSLPEPLMVTIQSIKGSIEDGKVLRRGLKSLLTDVGVDVNKSFEVNGVTLTLKELDQEIIEAFHDNKEIEAYNPIIEILSRKHYAAVKEIMGKEPTKDLQKAYLNKLENLYIIKLENEKQQNKLGDKLYELSQFQERETTPVEKQNTDIIKSNLLQCHEYLKIAYKDKNFNNFVPLILGIIVMTLVNNIIDTTNEEKKLILNNKRSIKKLDKTKEENEISDIEMANSAFGQGSFTARLLKERRKITKENVSRF